MNPEPSQSGSRWVLLVEDAVHEINQRWAGSESEDGEHPEPMDQKLAQETAEAILRPIEREVEDLRHALIWALSFVPEPEDNGGEYAEDHGGATRLAYPDQPENWS